MSQHSKGPRYAKTSSACRRRRFGISASELLADELVAGPRVLHQSGDARDDWGDDGPGDSDRPGILAESHPGSHRRTRPEPDADPSEPGVVAHDDSDGATPDIEARWRWLASCSSGPTMEGVVAQ